jgi:hypothetical protein
MPGQGCVEAPPEGWLDDGRDDEPGWPEDEPDDELDEGAVVVGLLCVVAPATASPAPMLSPKAPPPRARVTRGRLSFMTASFLQMRFSRCAPTDHSRPGQPWKLLRPGWEIG